LPAQNGVLNQIKSIQFITHQEDGQGRRTMALAEHKIICVLQTIFVKKKMGFQTKLEQSMNHSSRGRAGLQDHGVG
jgi:hypothetical protein